MTSSQVDRSITVPRIGGARLALNALFLGALGIAFAPIFVRMSQVGPSATAFWRLALAWPALFLWMQLESRGQAAPRRPSSRSDYLRLVAAGLFFAGDLAIWHWSIRFTSVANATLLANFAPIFVALGGWLFFRQRVSLKFLLGMGIALVGTLFMVGQSFRLSAQHLWGDALGLVTAMFYAGYLLSVKELRSEFSTATIMTWSGIVSCLVLLPVALLSGEGLLPMSAAGWWVLLGLALISHFGGQSLIAFALAKLPAAFSSVALLVQPVAAAVFAWLILSEALSPWQALAGALALAGIFVARRASL
jgi:drug/metabolite transporter (DMT)-like permease